MPKITRKPRGRRQSGQALILVAVGMVAFIAAAGLAIDMGYLRYQRRLVQSAADSAALAGAAAAGVGGDVDGAAMNDATLNGFQNGKNNATVTVTPTTFNGNASAVQVQVSAIVPTFFMRIFPGAANQRATISATATAEYTSARTCMFALQGGGGLNIGGGVTVNAQHCGVLSAEGLSVNGRLNAASIGVHDPGAVNGATPQPIFGVPQTPDPLANLPVPQVNTGTAPCASKGAIGNIDLPVVDPKTKKISDVAQDISPDFPHCLIIIHATQTQPVTFHQGIYLLGDPQGTNNGGIVFQGSGKVIVDHAMFFLRNGTINIAASQKIQMTAPTDGTYAGILFFQDKGDTAPATINLGNNRTLQGGFYFPRASLSLNGPGSASGAYMLFVAKTLNLGANISFTSDYTSLPSSPIKSAELVQ
jgi:Flp pilus assembly protein TadG